MSRVRRFSYAVFVLGLVIPGSAAAHSASGGTGGAAVPLDPKVAQAVCEDSGAWECGRGAQLTLEGEALDDVRQVRFVGGRGAADDQVARPVRKNPHTVEIRVPSAARSGRIAVVSGQGRRVLSNRRLKVRAASPTSSDVRVAPATPPAAGAATGVFPIAGKHDYGTAVNAFGGGRGHKGNDVFAKCGTPLVALFDAKVQFAGTQSRAGNYVVLQTADGQSFPYMHMLSAALVKKGATVRAGQPVGRVGESGQATGCHLHMEQWTAPGWYTGGKAIDPRPLLKSLDG